MLRVILAAFTYIFLLSRAWFTGTLNKRYNKEKVHNPLINGNFSPVTEKTKSHLDIVGKVPDDIDGIYVRNGPNPYIKIEDEEFYHFFDGDGMLHGINFESSKEVTYLNRWVNTIRLQEEKQVGKALPFTRIGEVRDPVGFFLYCVRWIKNSILIFLRLAPPPQLGSKTANTALEFHAGRFLALNETDIPYQVKLPSLETVGPYDFLGQFNFPPNHFTAHPKIDHATNHMIAFSYSLDTKPFCRYYVFDENDKLLRQVPIHFDIPVFMHDFAVTKTHSIIFNLPFQFRLDKVLECVSPFMFDPTTPSKFGILPRMAKDQSEIIWFESPACYMWHGLNAWDDGDEVVLYGLRSDTVNYFKLTDAYATPEHPIPDKSDLTYLHLWRFNLKTKTVTERNITKAFGCEFPTINNRYLGLKNKYGYIGRYGDRNVKEAYIDAVIKLDLASDKDGQDMKYTVYEFPKGWYSQEWLFVPRVRQSGEESKEQEEDDGYVMSYMYDSENRESEFWVLDASSNFGKEGCLLARIKIGSRVPYGFHGKFVTRQQMSQQVYNLK
eukprot:TRINITY_DN15673_c0_g1_i1.p1 TRINITY_DN15673_c0_g1~~TRINITY_DN15673_c0_g1_i1.p1  ORF type:complete len:552 (+),score=123.49 TRINITY_DN15673_c0_g1_i1:103-1758(+)